MKEGKTSKTDKDQSVKDWFKTYVASPKYKERLSAFYKYPEYIQRKRAERIENVGEKNVSGDVLKYDPDINIVKISDAGLRNATATADESIAHEYGHSLNSPKNPKAAALSPREEGFIFDRNKSDKDSKKDLKDSAMRQALGLSEYLQIKPSLHNAKPSESHSDINAFRFLLNKRGIYDAGKQDITPEILQKAAKDPVIRKSFIYKRLKENFEDQGLLEIMNKVASTKNKQSNIA